MFYNEKKNWLFHQHLQTFELLLEKMILLSINQPKKINSVLEHTNLALPLLAINIGSLQTPFTISDKQKDMI